MRYLVTGGCGFIGTHLAAALQQAGHRVHVLDDLSNGRKERLPSGIPLRVADVCDEQEAAAALAAADGCFHLAAIASVTQCEEHWKRAHEVNLTAGVQLMRLCAEREIPIVYASSAAVYGACPPPHRETALPSPLSGYGADKLSCEYHAAALAHRGLRSAGLRFFNIYGPGQDPSSPYAGVISRFAQRLLAGQELILYGDGGQERDFVYVTDAVSALQRAMERLHQRALPQAVCNVCTGRATSIRQLGQIMARLCDTEAIFRREDARGGDIRYSRGDPARLRRRLGIACDVPLKEGLRQTLQWMRGQGG